jgi:hypothetical protein
VVAEVSRGILRDLHGACVDHGHLLQCTMARGVITTTKTKQKQTKNNKKQKKNLTLTRSDFHHHRHSVPHTTLSVIYKWMRASKALSHVGIHAHFS